MDDTDPRFEMDLQQFETTLPGVGPQAGSRRTAHRYPFRAQVEAVPLDGRCQPIHGATEDICDRGVFIKARTRLPLDSLVVLKLNTAHGSLKLSGRVVHNIENIGFGCEFIDLDERQRTALRLLVSLHAAPTPRTLH